jgi:hypothetical protein
MNNFNPQSLKNLKDYIQTTLNNSLRTFFVKKTWKDAKWTPEEDQKLKNLVLESGRQDWKKIADYFDNKTALQCLYRWKKVLRPETYTSEDDQKLLAWVKVNGACDWAICSKVFKKSLKSLMARYEQLTDDGWNLQNEFYLLQAVQTYGTCWSRITRLFRDKINVKRKFFTILKSTASQHHNNIQVSRMKVSELLYFLPNAIVEYKSKLEHIDCISRGEDKCKNICTACRERIKDKIKSKMITSLLHNDEKRSDWDMITKSAHSIEKIKSFLKDKLNLYSINN